MALVRFDTRPSHGSDGIRGNNLKPCTAIVLALDASVARCWAGFGASALVAAVCVAVGDHLGVELIEKSCGHGRVHVTAIDRTDDSQIGKFSCAPAGEIPVLLRHQGPIPLEVAPIWPLYSTGIGAALESWCRRHDAAFRLFVW